MSKAPTYRIGSGAGYSGDRIDPAQDLAERGELNALVFECLAERTIALAQLRRAADPTQGYDPLLRERMRFSDSGRDSFWQAPRPPTQPNLLQWLIGLR